MSDDPLSANGENLEGVHQGHLPGEATPGDVPPPGIALPVPVGLSDSSWTEEQWKQLIESLIDSGIANRKDIAALVLGSLNPSQFGTSMASAEGFKQRYGKGNTMRMVMEWAYAQNGKCADCGSRLDLQADHAQPKESFDDPLDADFIENMVFRCRRCNVIRRPSHAFGGVTFLTAESGLMWILLVIRPRTFEDFIRLCRLYGMTMADIRMQEAWAMAHWLAKETPPAYGIEDDQNGFYDLLLWPDNAVTRTDSRASIPREARRIYENIPGNSFFAFVVETAGRVRFFEASVSEIPFSTYDLGEREPQALAVKYVPPDRESRTPQQLAPLPPRNLHILGHGVRNDAQHFRLTSADAVQGIALDLPPGSMRGVVLRVEAVDFTLNAENVIP